jgi:2-polyprenyl-3-methyl-5-hydroxy-6-metoxy-1,4-benzoquinol methylase
MRAWAAPKLKAILLRTVSALTRRHAALLGAQAADEQLIFRLAAPYRVAAEQLAIELLETAHGELTATLVGYDGHFPRRTLWQSPAIAYAGPCSFLYDLSSGEVRVRPERAAAGRAAGEHSLGRAPVPDTRRFCWRFELVTERGTRQRLTGHYRPADGRAVDRSYYYGDDYIDYAEQSRGDAAVLSRLLREFDANGPLLEIGCATGQLLAALARDGYEVSGVDFSEWAVEQAARALGPDRVFSADVEAQGFPAPILARAPFGAVILWMVLEHFRDPFAVLAAVRGITRPASIVLIYTTNADSLSHHIFGDDWEGYFDWTHHGVDRVSVRSLREAFAPPDWELRRLTTETFWAVDADPIAAGAREWFDADARFRRLLSERDLGDFLLCVAVRR